MANNFLIQQEQANMASQIKGLEQHLAQANTQ